MRGSWGKPHHSWNFSISLKRFQNKDKINFRVLKPSVHEVSIFVEFPRDQRLTSLFSPKRASRVPLRQPCSRPSQIWHLTPQSSAFARQTLGTSCMPDSVEGTYGPCPLLASVTNSTLCQPLLKWVTPQILNIVPLLFFQDGSRRCLPLSPTRLRKKSRDKLAMLLSRLLT